MPAHLSVIASGVVLVLALILLPGAACAKKKGGMSPDFEKIGNQAMQDFQRGPSYGCAAWDAGMCEDVWISDKPCFLTPTNISTYTCTRAPALPRALMHAHRCVCVCETCLSLCVRYAHPHLHAD